MNMTTNDKMPDAIYYDGSDAWDCARHSNVTKYTRADLADARVEKLVEALDVLARLGSGYKKGEGYGNSRGNTIALAALAQYEKEGE